jgi:hypothetical protein
MTAFLASDECSGVSGEAIRIALGTLGEAEAPVLEFGRVRGANLFS